MITFEKDKGSFADKPENEDRSRARQAECGEERSFAMFEMAGATGLEPAASCVTGRRSKTNEQ